MTIKGLLILAAVIVFVLAGLGVVFGKMDIFRLMCWGLALFAGSFLAVDKQP